VPVPTPSGTVVIREGDAGDRYYAVAKGELEITRSAVVQQTVCRGAGFGEIALIRDVPRQATVTALCDSLLYSLEKDVFIETITGNVAASQEAGTVITEYLGESAATPIDEDIRMDEAE
jgi:CRP-like cAMP-binding protein